MLLLLQLASCFIGVDLHVTTRVELVLNLVVIIKAIQQNQCFSSYIFLNRRELTAINYQSHSVLLKS